MHAETNSGSNIGQGYSPFLSFDRGRLGYLELELRNSPYPSVREVRRGCLSWDWTPSLVASESKHAVVS